MLLPHIDETGLGTVADSLSRAMAEWSIDVGDAVLHPSASVGFAVIDQQTASAEQVLVEADRAMYAAKLAKTATSPPAMRLAAITPDRAPPRRW